MNLLLLLSLFALGVPSLTIGEQCTGRWDCDYFEHCVSGTCVNMQRSWISDKCSVHADCDNNGFCHFGRCIDPSRRRFAALRDDDVRCQIHADCPTFGVCKFGNFLSRVFFSFVADRSGRNEQHHQIRINRIYSTLQLQRTHSRRVVSSKWNSSTDRRIIDVVYGISMNILYIPILAVMFEKEHFKLSCFKIMIFLGIVDMLALWVNSIIAGFLTFQGAVYCSFPNLIYISGMTGLGLWCCSCVIGMGLVLNRLLYLTKSAACKKIFDGKKAYLGMLVPMIYGMYFVIFTTPIVFTSKYCTWFFDPFIFEERTLEYANISLGFNNLFVVTGTCFLYVLLCCVLGGKFNEMEGVTSTKKMSTQIYLQSSLISAVNQIAAILCVIMNFIEVPIWFVMLANILWQIGHGAPVFIYLMLNNTIRNGVLKRVGCKKEPKNSVVVIV